MSYPRFLYHPKKAPDGKIVKDEKEEKALGKGWLDTPAGFIKVEEPAQDLPPQLNFEKGIES